MAAAFWLLTLSAVNGQAKMAISEPVQNAGKSKKGEVLHFNYVIKNTGSEPLIVLKSEVACSCTEVHYEQQPLAPGNTTTITVTFDTKSAIGRQDRTVILYSNDPKSPSKLRFKTNVGKPD